ncbi:MAG: hypothetical protein QM713_02750 [Arachnia sp.]
MSTTTSGLTAEHLLAGPRGRRMLLQFAVESERAASPDSTGPLGSSVFDASYRLAKLNGHAVYRFEWGPGADDSDHIPNVFPDDVTNALGGVRLIAPTAELLRSCLAQSVDAAMYWQEPDGDDLLTAIPSVREALGRVAEWVASSASASWLSTAIDRENQWELHWHDADTHRPQSTHSVLDAWRTETIATETDAHGSAYWWSTPPNGLPVSCGSLPDGAPSGLWFVEDTVGWKKADARRVEVPTSAAIYEIRSADDWATLCRRHPIEVTSQKRHVWQETTGRTGRWAVPDWSRVAKHYDAVHLSYTGYLSAAGVSIPVDDETASLIAGWNPDATYWFTDITHTGDPIAWRCHGYVGEGDWRV